MSRRRNPNLTYTTPAPLVSELARLRSLLDNSGAKLSWDTCPECGTGLRFDFDRMRLCVICDAVDRWPNLQGD